MASKRAAVPAKHLFNSFRAHEQPTLEAPVSRPPAKRPSIAPATPFQPQPNPFAQKAECTLYSFPSFEPVGLASYPGTHLLVPLRKDMLHRAVIFEGDATRQGSANTKWRSEVHGSGRKVRPQKGTGRARLGDKKSPMLRGGGVAFGPKPRDFSTDLPKKIYDRAWRMALSYRYRRDELMVTEGAIDVQGVAESSLERYVRHVLSWNRLSRDRGGEGRTLFVTMERREALCQALRGDGMYRHAKAEEVAWVDVKDLLVGKRVIVERSALETLFEEHESDLPERSRLRSQMPGLRTEVEDVMRGTLVSQ